MRKLVRVIATCKRFVNNCKLPKQLRKTGALSLEEIDEAWITIVTQVQKETFKKELHDLKHNKQVAKNSSLKQLNPYIDNHGVLRVGGRIKKSLELHETKHPAILPADHTITRMIIAHEHLKNLHAGPQNLLHILRQRVWILQARRVIRSVLSKCKNCFRIKPK